MKSDNQFDGAADQPSVAAEYKRVPAPKQTHVTLNVFAVVDLASKGIVLYSPSLTLAKKLITHTPKAFSRNITAE